MKGPEEQHDGSTSGADLIATGLLLALLGAGSVLLLILALSQLYVGRYGAAAGELIGCALGGAVFLRSYGPYLTRLEQRAPPEPRPGLPSEALPQAKPATASPPSDQQSPGAEPAPTPVVVALTTAAYGLLIALSSSVWARGTALVFNLLAGGALLGCAALVYWLGRPPGRGVGPGE
jgi:hypothetical protein